MQQVLYVEPVVAVILMREMKLLLLALESLFNIYSFLQ